MHILILAATGKIGTEIVNQFGDWNILPYVGVRDRDKARHRFGDRAQIVDFDFARPETWPGALKGTDRLFFIAPLGDASPVARMLDEARRAGVKKVVFSSGRTTGDVEGKPLHDAERAVRQCGIPYTILRPGWFMQNFSTWLVDTIRREDQLLLPAGSAGTAFIDVRDIAAVAIRTLLENGHNGNVYNLTSDRVHTHTEVVRLISEVTGRNISYRSLDEEEFIGAMTERGWTEDRARHTAALYRYVREGKEEEISGDVERILQRPPRQLEDYIDEHRQDWRPAEG